MRSKQSSEGMEEMSEDVIDQPFIQTSSSSNVLQQPPRRAGNVWSAVAHIITGVIGAGVLSLAWSAAQLGWIAGPLCIILFAATTLVSVHLLCDFYRFPHPEHGSLRSSSYMDAVKLYLGEVGEKVSGVLVYLNLFGTATAYIITTASSIRG